MDASNPLRPPGQSSLADVDGPRSVIPRKTCVDGEPGKRVSGKPQNGMFSSVAVEPRKASRKAPPRSGPDRSHPGSARPKNSRRETTRDDSKPRLRNSDPLRAAAMMPPPAPKPPAAAPSSSSSSSSSYSQYEHLRPENPLLLLPSSRAAKLSLGCPVLDRLLSGGLPAASITEIAGESATGKTQLCLQLALLAPQCPRAGASLFLHSDLPFPLRGLRRLAPRSTPDALDHVLVAAATSPAELLSLLARAQRVLARPARLPIRLILLDSVASLFRADFDASPADLRRRSALFFQISAKLRELAHRHQCVVVVTNQVVDVVDGDAGNTVAWSSGRRVSPALGIAWANCVNTRLFLTRETDAGGGTVRRRIKVAFAPHLPERSCEFVIRRDGVFGVEPAER